VGGYPLPVSGIITNDQFLAPAPGLKELKMNEEWVSNSWWLYKWPFRALRLWNLGSAQ